MELKKLVQDLEYLLAGCPARDLFAEQEVLQNGSIPWVADKSD